MRLGTHRVLSIRQWIKRRSGRSRSIASGKPRVRPRIIMDSVHPGEPQPTRPGDTLAGPSGPNRMPPAPGWGRRIFWFLFVLVIAAVLLGGAAYYEYKIKPAMMAQFFQAPPPAPVETAIAETEDMPRD